MKIGKLLAWAAMALVAPLASAGPPDWGKVPARQIEVFAPGVTPLDWIMNKSDHSGRTGLHKGESCLGCHEEKNGQLNFSFARMASREIEPVGAPQTLRFPVAAQAAYDSENLYIRLVFKVPADAPATVDKEDKAPRHEVKVAVMLTGPKVDMGEQLGCWAACHRDVRSMPGADPKKRKYVKEASVAAGNYLDYFQWKSGEGGAGATQLDGHVAAERINKGGQALVKADGECAAGTCTVIFTRKLSGGDGDLVLGEGRKVTFGIAVHADKTVYRYHHVSLAYSLGLGTGADLAAMKQ